MTQLGYRYEKNGLKLKPFGVKWIFLIVQGLCLWLSFSSWGDTEVRGVLESIAGTLIAAITLYTEHCKYVNSKSGHDVYDKNFVRIDDPDSDGGMMQSPFGIRMMYYVALGVFAFLRMLYFLGKDGIFDITVINFACCYINALEVVCALLVLLFDAEPA